MHDAVGGCAQPAIEHDVPLEEAEVREAHGGTTMWTTAYILLIGICSVKHGLNMGPKNKGVGCTGERNRPAPEKKVRDKGSGWFGHVLL